MGRWDLSKEAHDEVRANLRKKREQRMNNADGMWMREILAEASREVRRWPEWKRKPEPGDTAPGSKSWTYTADDARARQQRILLAQRALRKLTEEEVAALQWLTGYDFESLALWRQRDE